MVKIPPPTPNSIRQRQFRERNPCYYGRLHRKRKAAVQALAESLAAAQIVAVRREPLALPAPVEAMEIAGLNAIPTMAELLARRAEVKVAVAAS